MNFDHLGRKKETGIDSKSCSCICTAKCATIMLSFYCNQSIITNKHLTECKWRS